MKYLYEMHLHTGESSRCGVTPAREYIPYYMDLGYDGITVTDHFYGNPSYVPDRNDPWEKQIDEYCRGWEEAADEGAKRGFKVFFGIEQQFANDECLIYGPDKQWLLAHPDMPFWTRRQLLDEVEKAGGCIVLAHPFRVRDYVVKISLNTCVHAVEAYNCANHPQDDIYGLAFAKHYGYPVTAGTDMHLIGGPKELYAMTFDEPLGCVGDYARAIRERKTFGVKVAEDRGHGAFAPLERPYEYLDGYGNPVPWDVSILTGRNA